jgi:hypothetical protein
MADRMLWADQLGAVWPASSPRARSEEDRWALDDLMRYRDAGFFTECRVPVNNSEQLERELEKSLLETDHVPWLEQGSTGSFERINPPGDRSVEEHLFYMDKFPENIKQMLLRTGVAVETEPHGMLKVRSPKKAHVLINAMANYAVPQGSGDLPLTLDAEDDLALAQAAAPTPEGTSRPALVVEVPVIEGSWGDVTAERLIEFRGIEANNRARDDYLDEVAARVAKMTRLATDGDPAMAAKQMVSDQLDLATRSLAERVSVLGLTGLAISAVGTFTPISMDGAGDWVGFGATVAGLGLAAYTTLRPSPAHAYLRRARRAGVINRR